MTRKRYLWKLKEREIQLGDRTLLMGVLNVTPDSFSDGGEFLDPDRAFARAIELEDEGADIIDIGAESTRPGSKRISDEEELRRLVPVLKRLRGKLAVPISVDTSKSAVADKALALGAEIVNDPSAMTFDPRIVKVVVEHDAGLVLNHMRGTPDTWAKLPPLPDVMGAVYADLEACVHRARRAGLDKERVVVDPGIGFGKRKEQSAELIARLHELTQLDFPILAGPSRKSFLGQSTEEGKLFGSAAAVTACVLGGAHMVRVHDVKQMTTVARVADAILNTKR
ncbi:MAG: dihydropteroate synthase [bacterium]|nr:dihydropteroate synthase [bacterium]